jgi:RNA polymerase sigma factor (TIGR02999 family)
MSMPEYPSGEITGLLQRWVEGDKAALDAVVPVVYAELRRVAHHHLKSERPGHTLQSTALVNEAFLRLVGGEPVHLQNRAHFIGIASHLMRQILVDYARSRQAKKRDGGVRIPLEDLADMPGSKEEEPIVAVDRALDGLCRIDERQSKVVEMKFFGGLSAPEIAQVLGISLATVERDWRTARIWLRREMARLSL